MEYRTVKLDAFSVIGIKEFMSVENGENFTKIPQMWAGLPEETMSRLGELSNLEPSGVLGVCAGMHDNGFDYWIAAATTKECPAGFEKLDIPAAQWVVFDVVGTMPDAMQNTVKQVFNEWLPSSGYQHADAPAMEWYSVGDMSLSDYQSELWIPVIKQELRKMNKALVVIDIQNDITKNYREIIGNINKAIDWAVNNDIHVVYIRHENLSDGTRTFKPNTRGAELVPNLKTVSQNVFTKYKGNALSSEAFADFINKNGIADFYITGADAVACVKSTCYNLTKANYKVNVLSDCITSYDKRKIDEMLRYYESKGCKIISLNDLL